MATFSSTRPQRTPHRAAKTKTAASGDRVFKASPLTYAALIFAVFLSAFPIYWMLVIASRTSDAVNSVPPVMMPGGNLFDNINRVLDNDNAFFLRGITNSIIAASTITAANVLFGSMAGFAFAKLRFRGRNALLLSVLGTMMVPIQLGIIPLYMLMADLGWINDIKAIIVPFLVTGFGVFFMRQYTMESVPDELIEAARVDGCSTWRVYWNVVLPALRPACAVLGLLTFMQYWNDFFWPFVVLQGDQPTVQVSLKNLNMAYYADNAQIFAGTAMATLPLIVVFIFFGRQIIGGIMEGAVKA